MHAAELSNVSYKYGKQIALRNLSLTLAQGEVVSLLGANGAGKSTAVKLMLGLLKPACGTARVFGSEPSSPHARMRRGAMLQVARVPDTVRVREFIELFRSYYANPLTLDEVVARAGLAGFADKLMGHLSGGQRQRALFGLAIAGNPDIVFLDEPTVGLDIEARHALWAEVRRLRDAGKTVLLTTHYLEEADALADRIVMIRNGAVVAQGSPSQIKSQVTGRTIRCVTTVNHARIAQMPTVSAVRQQGMAVNIRCTDAETVLRAMFAADAGLHGLEVSSPKLEDAFLAMSAEEGAQQ